jgi:two-component system, NarL family, nitrate/nitrite response regulator NarL
MGVNHIDYMTSEIFETTHLQKKTVEAETVLIEFDNNKPDLIKHLTTVHNKNVLVMHKKNERHLVSGWIQLGIKGNYEDSGNPDSLYKALMEVQKGKFWISRRDSEEFFQNAGTKLAELKQSMKVNFEVNKLSKKELKVLREIGNSQGKPLKEVAEALFISEYTLRNHLTSIYKLLKLANRIELYIFYQKHEALIMELYPTEA